MAQCVAALGFGSTVRIGFLGPKDRITYASPILRQAEVQLKADGVVPRDLAFE